MHFNCFKTGELWAALAVGAVGAYLVWAGIGYGVGQPQRLGPGFLPVIVGTVLLVLAVPLLVEAWNKPAEGPEMLALPFITIIGSISAFAVLAPRYGLLPATFVLVVLSGAGANRIRPGMIAGVAVFMCFVAYFVFLRAFSLPLSALRW